jgi:hypothetical protein
MRDFESRASASSATPADCAKFDPLADEQEWLASITRLIQRAALLVSLSGWGPKMEILDKSCRFPKPQRRVNI